jgi:capsular exopolysaccharide synthesis family protein
MKNLPANPFERQITRSHSYTNASYADRINIRDSEVDKSEDMKLYLNIIKRRKWCIILSSFIFFSLAVIAALAEKTLYESKSRILIEKDIPKIFNVQELQQVDTSLEFFQTESFLVNSRENVEELVNILQLDKKPPEEESFLGKILRVVGGSKQFIKALLAWGMNMTASPTEPVAVDPAEMQRLQAIKAFLETVTVTPLTDTRLVDVAIQGDNPQETTQQVNTLVEVYLRKNLEKKLETSRKAIDWLTKKTADLKEQMQGAEQALQSFREKKKVVSLDLDGRRNIIQERLAGLHSAYTQANTARIDYETRLNKVRALSVDNIENIENITTLVDTSIIRNLRQKYLDALAEYKNSAEVLTPKHPRMVQLQSQVDVTKSAINQELQKIVNAMQSEYNILRSKESSLTRELNAQKESTLDLNNDMITYAALQNEVENQRALYNEAAKRLEEIKLTQASITNNIKVVDKASVPLEPTPSKKMLKLVLGLALGGTTGIGLAFIKEYFANRFKNLDEIESYLRIPFLGAIPRYTVSRRQGALPIALSDPTSAAAEAYRLLRTRIFPSASEIQTLLITSAVAGEGKTTTSTNLGISFAQLGLKVLILDLDLRRPTLHRQFQLSKDKGLTTLLLGQEEEWQSMLFDTGMPNLKILPAGPIPANPSDILCLGSLRRFMDQFKKTFDLVLVDAPLILSLPDVEILAPDMDGVIIVHDLGRCDKKTVFEALRSLERVGARILGLVLNNIEKGNQQYYYHSYYPSYHIDNAVSYKYNHLVHSNSSIGSSDPKNALDVIHKSKHQPNNSKIDIVVQGFQIKKEINGMRLFDNSNFLILDIEVYSKLDTPYYFNPRSVKLYVDAPEDYGLSLSKAMDDIRSDPSQDTESDSIYKYSEVTQTLENGMVQERVIDPHCREMGAIVFQIPENICSFMLCHDNEFISISVSSIKNA